MLRIEAVDEAPLGELAYLQAAPRGGSEVATLSLHSAKVAGLPPGLDGVLVTGDLQGRGVREDGESVLLGVAFAESLEGWSLAGLVPSLDRLGVLLAGDLYSAPGADKRGASGLVNEVWEAFADRFRWVAGVLGNHDDLGGEKGTARLSRRGRVHVLDGQVVELDGLRVGGVSYVIGKPERRGRRAEVDQRARITGVLEAGAEILVLHEGPEGDAGAGQRGHAGLRSQVEAARVPLTICGHVHWSHPLAHHAAGQILNVDARALLLLR